MPSAFTKPVFKGTCLVITWEKQDDMKLSDALLLKLRKKYEPATMVNLKFKGKEVSFKTDNEGNPVTLFIGRLLPDGKISGERYTRTLKTDARGAVIKDHWDRKGKAD